MVKRTSAFRVCFGLLMLSIGACQVVPDPAQSMADFCTKLPRAEYQNLKRLPVDSEWFEVYQITPSIMAIYEPHQWQEVISYLILGETSALLFDTGNGIADIYKLVSGLTDKPITVFNSHGHYDHVGGNYSFETIVGMNTEFTRSRQSGQSNAVIGIEASAQALCVPLPEGVSEKNHIGRTYNITEFIEHGAIIDLGGRQLEVIHIPGHTPDAVALIDRVAGLLWTGDSYYSGPIWLFAEETDLTEYARTLDRLIQEIPNVTALLPAHNVPWVDQSVLLRVKEGLEKMLKGETQKVSQGDGMIEHRIADETEFSFLMRDEPLPYRQ